MKTKMIEILKYKIGFWLINTKETQKTMTELTNKTTSLRCDHCGNSPIHFLDNCTCEKN